MPWQNFTIFLLSSFFSLEDRERETRENRHSPRPCFSLTFTSFPFFSFILFALRLSSSCPFQYSPLSFTIFFPTSFNLEHFSLPLSHDLFYSLFLISLLFSFISRPTFILISPSFPPFCLSFYFPPHLYLS